MLNNSTAAKVNQFFDEKLDAIICYTRNNIK